MTDQRLYYEGLTPDAITERPPGPDGVEVDGCHLRWTRSRLGDLLNGPDPDGGPVPGGQLGVLTVVPTGYGRGWVGTDFRRC